MSVATNDKLHTLLSELHAQSDAELYTRARKQFTGNDEDFRHLAQQYGNLAPRLKGKFLKEHGLSSNDSDASQGTSLSLSISAEMGNFLRNLALAHRPNRILELGSSCGVSALYFADALRKLEKGSIVATELDALKCSRIRDHVNATGLASYVDLREGNVFDTIATLDGTFDFVFIDLWASAYLDAFRKIEHLLRPGSVVITDNMYTAEDEARSFKQYVDSHPAFLSTTLDFESGVEFTVAL